MNDFKERINQFIEDNSEHDYLCGLIYLFMGFSMSIIGLALIWYYISFAVAGSIFLLFWSNNISNENQLRVSPLKLKVQASLYFVILVGILISIVS